MTARPVTGEKLTPQQYQQQRTKGNKYRAVRVQVDGQWFDSKKEAARWKDLNFFSMAGEIHGLRRRVTFPLTVNGIIVGRYTPDAVYSELKGDQVFRVAEDTKSPATRKRADYRLRVKLFQALYPEIVFREV